MKRETGKPQTPLILPAGRWPLAATVKYWAEALPIPDARIAKLLIVRSAVAETLQVDVVTAVWRWHDTWTYVYCAAIGRSEL